MITKRCQQCGEFFQAYPSKVGRYCSRICSGIEGNLARALNMRRTFESRFWKRVNKKGNCWLWLGAVMDRGYGSVKCGDRGALLVHRVAWELVRGPIPDGLDVLHSCDVRLCAKPDHLFLGTHLDNMRDMISKGRDVHFSGEQNGNSKLSIEDVDDIRCLLLKGVTGIELARRFGVSAGNISHIKTGRIWS